jgi:pilus assembly protein Flp/PilA
MPRTAMRLVKDRGASAVEYGLMIAAIAAVILAIVFSLGGVTQVIFTDTCDTIAARVNGGDCAPDP